MTARVAINGFGRIGRLTLRAMLERHKQELNVVAINDMADLQPMRTCFATTRPTAYFRARLKSEKACSGLTAETSPY